MSVQLRKALRALWRGLREWSGDAAYETYLARGGDDAKLDRQAYFLNSLRRRYRDPSRCC